MAKVMPYLDDRGNSYENSYWRIVQINIGIVDRTAVVLLYGYKDQESRAAGRQSIGAKSYTVSGELFDTLYAKHMTSSNNVGIFAYTEIVSRVKDIPNPENPDEQVNFFEGATDLL